MENFYLDLLKLRCIFFLIVIVSWGGMGVFNCYSTLAVEDRAIYNFISLSTYLLYIFIVGYLLLTLYIICLMVKSNSGPLRRFT